MKILFRIVVTALAVMLADRLLSGISVSGFWVAVLVAVVIGILNIVIGLPLKILTAPLSILTFGFFIFIINALVFWAATFVKGFYVRDFSSAFC